MWQIAAEKQAKDGVPEYPWNTFEDYDMYDERRSRQHDNMEEYGEEEQDEEELGGEGGENEIFEGEYGEEEQEEMSVQNEGGDKEEEPATVQDKMMVELQK